MLQAGGARDETDRRKGWWGGEGGEGDKKRL